MGAAPAVAYVDVAERVTRGRLGDYLTRALATQLVSPSHTTPTKKADVYP